MPLRVYASAWASRSGIQPLGSQFASDSALEGAGFELSAPDGARALTIGHVGAAKLGSLPVEKR